MNWDRLVRFLVFRRSDGAGAGAGWPPGDVREATPQGDAGHNPDGGSERCAGTMSATGGPLLAPEYQTEPVWV